MTLQYRIEPVITITFPWGSYTNKTGIRSISTSENQVTNLSSVATLSVIMDDTDGAFKTQVDAYQLQGAACSVTLAFVGVLGNYTIISGVITSDIIWVESDRSFKFNVESIPNSGIVGYAPPMVATSAVPNGYGWDWGWTIEDWPYAIGGGTLGKLNKSNATKAWPVVFGTALKVPALRLTDLDTGSLADNITQSDVSFEVIGGEDFKQNDNISLDVGGVTYIGQFNDSTTFNVSSSNVVETWSSTYYSSMFDARPTGDMDVNKTHVAWVVDNVNYRGKFIYVECVATGHPNIGKTFALLVKAQEGRKLFFGSNAPFIVDENYEVQGFAGALKSTWLDENGDAYTQYVEDENADLGTIHLAETWRIAKGARIFDSSNLLQYYICNFFSGSTLHAVYAYRTFDNKRRLEQVPSSYYVFDATSTAGGGYTVTALILPTLLSNYPDEGWEDNLYVTLSSTGSSNTATAIEAVLNAYTSLTPDATTFTAVKVDIAAYQQGFALLESKDALKFCEEIAWQARCSLYREGNTVYIRYLSEAKTSAATLTESVILADTLQLGFTNIDDIVTAFKANWNEDYSENGERVYTYTNNTSSYGNKTQEFDFYIYNQPKWVGLSADFWGYRMSNIWRSIRFELPVLDYTLRPQDQIEVTHGDFVGDKCFLQGISYNFNDNTIAINAEAACKMAASGNDSTYWTGSPAIGGEIALPNKATGVSEKDFAVPVITSLPARAYDVKIINNTGSTVDAYTTWKIGSIDAEGYAELTALTLNKDDGMSVGDVVIVMSTLADGEKGSGMIPNKGQHRVEYDHSFGAVKRGQIWSLLYNDLQLSGGTSPWNTEPVGKIRPMGQLFLVMKDLGLIGTKYYALVSPLRKGKTGNVVFRQEDGLMPNDGAAFAAWTFEDFGVIASGMKIKTYSHTSYNVQLLKNGAPVGTVYTEAIHEKVLLFAPNLFFERGDEMSLRVTSSVGCVQFECTVFCMDILQEATV